MKSVEWCITNSRLRSLKADCQSMHLRQENIGDTLQLTIIVAMASNSFMFIKQYGMLIFLSAFEMLLFILQFGMLPLIKQLKIHVLLGDESIS